MKKLADLFFQWYCKEEYYSDIRGDLEELYQQQIQNVAKWRADWMYVKEILLLLRLTLIKSIFVSSSKLNLAMFLHHLKIALRYMYNQKIYTTIKIGGLAVGMAACLLLVLYTHHEISYDSHIPESERIYRMVIHNQQKGTTGSFFPAPMKDVILAHYPEVELVGRFRHPLNLGAKNYIRSEDQIQNSFEGGFIYTDASILELLQIPMVYGDISTALSEPNTIIISESKGEKFFPGENPLGKTLIINDNESQPIKIGGVMEDFPTSSHLQYDFLLSLAEKEFWPGEQNYWPAFNYQFYVKLKKDVSQEAFLSKLPFIIDNYFLPSWRESGNANAQELADNLQFDLQPLQDIYLHSAGINDRMKYGDLQLVWLFGISAFLILLVACVNFTNLSTARSFHRAREVGIRKTVGAIRSQLMGQFLVESILYSFISISLGLLLAYILLPHFNQLIGTSLVLPLNHFMFFMALIIIAIGIGILSGIYPSIFLSSFKPIHIIRGFMGPGSKQPILRNVLVVFQFTVSSILIMCTIIIYQQMSFALNKKIGFEKDQVIMVHGINTLGDDMFSLKEVFKEISGVQSVSISDYLPIEGTKRGNYNFWLDGRREVDEGVYTTLWKIDVDYLETLGMNLLDGRNFREDMASDSQAIIVNELFVNKMGFDNPLGKVIGNEYGTFTIIGVVADFHFNSLREDIYPVGLALHHPYLFRPPTILSVKVQTDHFQGLLKDIHHSWEKFAPHQPLQYTFLDENYANMYQDVIRSGYLFNSFAVLAIGIACLGLLGLTSFIAEQRAKEVSIRKVLGANLFQIVQLLSKNFLLLSLISVLLATPIAWYLMENWLEEFAYRIHISWYIFLIAGGIIMCIAFFTMSFHVFKVALGNPIRALRME